MASSLMIQGTGSHVGKSIITAGFCRLFSDMGLKVAPFKSQNMSLNSFATADGAEMARAQELQARAARVEPTEHMNPVLLKPIHGDRCEVILQGRSIGEFSAREYFRQMQQQALEVIAGSLHLLMGEYEIVVIEGAGSPAEVNLRRWDICNMKIARLAEAPVLLVADIDTGGALASVVGTLELLRPGEREAVRGIIVNKFRGDIELLKPGLIYLERRTRKKVVGVLPFMDCSGLDEEDTPRYTGVRGAEIAVVKLPYMSNFTDLVPLEELSYRWVVRPEELEGVRLLIIPGSRNTGHDLRWLRDTGLFDGIRRMGVSGTAVIGICGGYQLLGEALIDPDGLEGGVPELEGLSLLPVETRYIAPKITRRVKARVVNEIRILPGLNGAELTGYEIHTGRVDSHGAPSPLVLQRDGEEVPDGTVSEAGNVFGTHLHGLFDNKEVVDSITRFLGRRERGVDRLGVAETGIEDLAAVMGRSLDLDYVLGLVGK